MSIDLKHKVAIVTGAASGIGRATVIAFAAAGAKVIAADVADGVHETVRIATDAGGTAIALIADAGHEADVVALTEAASTHFGGLDIFFANAGITGGAAAGFEASADVWLEVLRVNLIGPFLAVKHATPLLIARGGGSIICTASVAGIRAGAGPAAYSASKAGVINLVKTAALQFAGTGIRINAICPGLVETGMTRPALDMARAAGFGAMIGKTNPARRAGTPEDIAGVALFLSSSAASFINGQALPVDGGLSALHPTTPRPQAAVS